MQRQSLNCWKEIAAYLGCGVRTAQRWERNLGLPVRRPNVSEYRVVVAFEDELDQWREMWNKAEVSQAESFAISLERLEEDIHLLQSVVRDRARDGKVRSIVITFETQSQAGNEIDEIRQSEKPLLVPGASSRSKLSGAVKQAESLLSTQVLIKPADRDTGITQKAS